MGALLLLLVFIFVPVIGFLVIKKLDQQSRDHYRKTYRLAFPSDLTTEDVESFIRSVSGTLRASRSRLTGVPTIVFEMWATDQGIMHRIKVPWQHADYVVAQLRALVSGIRVTPEEEFPSRVWTSAVEVGLSHTSRQLRIIDASVISTSLLASVQALEADEAVLMQWVITPAIPRHPPPMREATPSTHIRWKSALSGNEANRDELRDRREKLEQPNLQAVLRVASFAQTEARARHLIYRVRASLASTRSASTRFTKRLVVQANLQRRIDLASAPMMYSMQLSTPELAALIAWPIGNPFVVGLPQTVARQFPPHQSVPSEGLVIGISSFPGSERKIAIPFAEALMHTHVLGKTGVGKSVLLAHLARQIMQAGYGLILMETEGNLYQSVLDYVPKDRIDDVVLLDVQDRQYPVGFNVLDQGNRLAVIDQIIDLFIHKFGKEGMGVWAQEYIYHGLRTIAETPDLSFTDLVTLLNPRADEVEWVDNITRSLTDPELRRWWQRHDNRDKKQQQQRADPVLSRIWQLASRPELRYIMGQSKSTFAVSDLMRGNKILLVNLKGVSKDTAALAGTLLMNAIWQAVKTVPKAKQSYLILDEFADFMDLPIDTESMLAQARKHGVGMVLANQHLSQLKPAVRDAVVSNARSKVIFQSNADDARLVGREFGAHLTVEDFTHLQAYEAIARIQTAHGTSSPMSINTVPPGGKSGVGAEVVRASRQKYGRNLAEVQAEIEGRHRIKPTNIRKRPSIGSA